MQPTPHQAVLFKEIIHALHPRPDGRYVDATVGAGGHTRGILEASSPDGLVLGLDVDPSALDLVRKNLAPFGQRLILARASYASVPEQLAAAGWEKVDGIVFDLGASSMQFDTTQRGFSFRREAPLDMRFDPDASRTAADAVNHLPEAELATIIRDFGEERHARRFAQAIVSARPIASTTQLASVVEAVGGHRKARIHPATRVFQALRIWVNDELETLRHGLPRALQFVRPSGRLAIISFHSLEDRIVKQFFGEQSRAIRNPPFEPIHAEEREATVRLIGPQPLIPSAQEIAANPRARSAKLRVAEKL